jgi:Tfp pilus assembly protein PilV
VKSPVNERGTTLIEAMIAVLVALIGVFGLGTLIFQATVTNKNQGTEVTRATIYAQDKMEFLLSEGSATGTANFTACTQGIATNALACNSSGINVTAGSAWNSGLLAGGVPVDVNMVASCPTAGASIGYVDFLDINGAQITGASCAVVNGSAPAYSRMWLIADVPATGGPAMKQISVGVWSVAAVNTSGAPKPVVVLTSYMSNPN